MGMQVKKDNPELGRTIIGLTQEQLKSVNEKIIVKGARENNLKNIDINSADTNESILDCLNKFDEIFYTPKGYLDYNKMFEESNPDCVYIATSWETHIEIAISAMKHGVYAGLECGGATSIEQCHDLIKAYKETGTKVMFLENCCYGRDELMVMNMVR